MDCGGSKRVSRTSQAFWCGPFVDHLLVTRESMLAGYVGFLQTETSGSGSKPVFSDKGQRRGRPHVSNPGSRSYCSMKDLGWIGKSISRAKALKVRRSFLHRFWGDLTFTLPFTSSLSSLMYVLNT